MGFFSSLFSPGKQENELDDQQKPNLKNFNILKYDGIRAQSMRKPEYAVKCFTEALKIQKDFETLKYLMSTYFMLHRFDEALEVLNEMAETDDELANTLLTRAGVLSALARNEEAVADCMKAIDLDPDNSIAYFQLAKSKRALDELTSCIDSLTKAVDLKDDFAAAYMLRAEAYLSLKKENEALRDAEKIVALTPEDETVYLLRGRILESTGNAEAALSDYQEASALNPFNEAAYLLSGRLLMTGEKYDEAISVFDEAIEHNEQFAAAYAERGRAKDKKGDKEGAAADIRKSEELTSDDEEKSDTGNRGFDDLYKGNII